MNTPDPSSDSAWALLGDCGADEAMIVGSREGLVELRNAIDRAIEDGESSISVQGIEFNGIRRVDTLPESHQESSVAKFTGIGCLVLLGLCLLIFVFGVVELFRQFF